MIDNDPFFTQCIRMNNQMTTAQKLGGFNGFFDKCNIIFLLTLIDHREILITRKTRDLQAMDPAQFFDLFNIFILPRPKLNIIEPGFPG